MNRRTFIGGSLAALGLSRLVRLAHSEVPRAPTRLLLIHKPNGTIPDAYNCTGTGAAFVPSPILEPFADLRSSMVVVDGLDILKKPNTPGEDHGNGMVTFTTGGITFRGDASSVPLAVRPSIDQLLAREAAVTGDTPIGSLQLAADARSYALFTRTLSYACPGMPVPSVQRPQAAYARVFGSLADPSASPADLERIRTRQQSVLDFAATDLQRTSQRLAGPERERLDRHLEAIREVERLLDRNCADRALLGQVVVAADPDQPDAHHAELGRAHFEIVRAAFHCDLTRVVTFGWASGQSFVNFSGLIPGVESRTYHDITHQGAHPVEDGIAVHRWYNERLAEMLRAFRATIDIDGRSMLDNMIVVVWSEMQVGSNHSFHSVPIQVFGGGGGRLVGGRRLVYDHRPTNDLLLSVANAMGHPMTSFGDAERCTGPLPDLFG